jgi:hypothetical protein
VTHPATTWGHRISHQTESAEIDLQLIARCAVIHPDRRAPPAPADIAHLQRIAMQRPLRHHHTTTRQQLVRLAHRQLIVPQPALDELMMGDQQPPRATAPIDAMRAHRLHHRSDELIGELPLALLAAQTQLDRSSHVAADRLAVHPRQPLR